MSARRYALQIAGDDKAFLRSKSRPHYERGAAPVSIVDVFAGCGGLTLGVAEACRAAGRGIDIRLAVERSEAVFAVYRSNFRPAVDRASGADEWFDGVLGDAPTANESRTRELAGRVELLVGGPPCQGHSNLNNYTRRRDPKNALYDRMVRAAEILRPQHLIVENVPDLQLDRNAILPKCIDALKDLGYRLDHQVVNVATIGVPQLRKRHVLVGSLTFAPDITRAVQAARLPRVRNLRWAIADLDGLVSDALIDRHAKLSPENLVRAKWLRSERKYDLDNSLRPRCHRRKSHRYKSMYGRLRWDEPAQTITSGFGSPGQGRYLHPKRLRTITAHEAARIQFLPDWFDFSAVPHREVLKEIIGNLVPPKLGFVLGSELLRHDAPSARPRLEANEPLNFFAL